jgi:hypothetical protein
MPEATLNAVKESGVFSGETITPNIKNAKINLAKIALAGIDIAKVTDALEIDGIAKSGSKNEFAIAISQLVGVSPRPGYSNTFNWAVDNIAQRRQPVKVIETNCNLCCEHVAVYRESGFKPVLVPCCGNLPY